ncbi:MAG: PTS sugar transporter subunit IIA [Treponema sp.]|jgi:mannitol/fructose-specific phosphotransferase system IIA component (Ntr-type)|nr:PTS sugar transporter subunit IIA [Treponema sp.]
MLLSEVFDLRCIKPDLKSTAKPEVFKELIETIIAVHPELDREEMFAVVNERENKMTTSVIPGVAVPHGCYPGISDVIGAIGISRTGIAYNGDDNKPVYCVFLLLMGEESREKHLHVLNKVFTVLNTPALARIRAANSPQEVYDIMCRFH